MIRITKHSQWGGPPATFNVDAIQVTVGKHPEFNTFGTAIKSRDGSTMWIDHRLNPITIEEVPNAAV